MKVLVTAPAHDIEVSIGADEIADALNDMPNEKCTWVLASVAQVLKAISDFQIHEQMHQAQRAIIRDFLTEQAARYAELTDVAAGAPP